MKVLLVGGSGLLGRYFQLALATQKINFLAPKSSELDITDSKKLTDFFKKNPPKIFNYVINCAAYTNVEKAESEHELAERVNVRGVENLLEYKIPIINISTDYVFGHFPMEVEIEENFPRFPINFYGGTKLRGEKALEGSKTPHWNIRTSWLFGAGESFVTKFFEKFSRQSEFEVIDDQVGRPTFAQDLAEFITKNFINEAQPTGDYHLQNSGKPVSWAEVATYLAKKTNWPGQVVKKSADFFDFRADRPQNSVLKNTKLKTELRPWTEAMDEFLATLN